MKLPKGIQRLLPRIHLYAIVGVLVYVIAVSFLILPFGPSLIIAAIASAIMLAGQISSNTHYSFAYPLYNVSCAVSLALAFFIWMMRNLPFADLYVILLTIVFAVIYVLHIKSRKRLGPFPLFSLFSIFLFALLIILSAGAVSPSTSDWLFGLTLVLLVPVTVQNLNVTYRCRILNRELRIRNVDEYLVDCEEGLLSRFRETQSDVDLLIYYLDSSLERFAEGDFERSFMDAYKIVFDSDKGTAFARIYVLPDLEEKMKQYSSIRAMIAHAKGRGARLPEIKEMKKKLFDDTLGLLKVVKFEFMDAALARKESS